jgi:hypothetical protein
LLLWEIRTTKVGGFARINNDVEWNSSVSHMWLNALTILGHDFRHYLLLPSLASCGHVDTEEKIHV